MGSGGAQKGETNSIDINRKLGPKSKHGKGIIEQDDLVFNQDNAIIEEVEGDLHSQFSDYSDTRGDKVYYEEDTDWENYENDITFERKGNGKSMFKQKIYDEALRYASREIKAIFDSKGAFKIKRKDIPQEISPSEVEFKNIQCSNNSGDAYIGEFRKGTTIREGRGILISSENYMYEGYWMDDEKYGIGRILIFNGNMYQGEWRNDVSGGRGIYSTSDGLIYKGEWKDNKGNGDGVEIYQDGSKFVGKFKNGEKSGKGRFLWADGKKYFGYFRAGFMDGYGEFSWPDGRIYKGNWASDK